MSVLTAYFISKQTHLVTDQIPLLLVVVLTEELHFVRRKIHCVLKTENVAGSYRK